MQKSIIKMSFRTEFLPALCIILSFGLSFYFFANFPDVVPTHWNVAGEIDGYSSRGFAAFFFPFLLLFVYLLFLSLPFIDPKKDRYAEFAGSYHRLKNLLVAFLFLIYVLVGLSGMGYDVPIGFIVPAGVGVLFISIGNSLGKIKRNFMMGIRTPWAISSEENWNKTNRFAGKTLIAAGLIFLFMGAYPLSARTPILIGIVVICVVLPVFYSYFLFRKEQKDVSDSSDSL